MLSFLKSLANNNNREWFTDHKTEYQDNLKVFKSLVNDIENELNKFDNIEKSKVFRIYRDVRFSKDKTPYKTSFSAAFTRATKKLRGTYYLHIEPNNIFTGGGFWGPEPSDLKRIRKEFELDRTEMDHITQSKEFVSRFDAMQGDEVKSAPKGFDKNHPNIDLIKKKQFLVSQKFDDSLIKDPNLVVEIANSFRAMKPFFDYFSSILTTDLNGESII